MKIRTRLTISMVVFIIAFIIISVSILTTTQQVGQMNRLFDTAIRVQTDAYDLSQLSSDYALHREARQRIQWEAKFNEFSADLAALEVSNPEQQALRDSISRDQQHLKEIFLEISHESDTETVSGDNTAGGAHEAATWSRMAIPNAKIVFEATRLAGMIRDESDRVQQQHMLLMYGLVGITLIFLLVNFFYVHKHILRGISSLEAGTRIIGSGDLEFRIEEEGDDEFRDLACSFNAMAQSRKEADEKLRDEVERTRAAYEQLAAAEKKRDDLIDELQRTNAELDRFAYSVSHDLKSPLISIRGFTELLHQDISRSDTEQSRHDLMQINKSALRMEDLISTLLALSRSGRQIDLPQPVALGDITREAAGMLEKSLSRQKVRLTIRDNLPIVSGDPRRLLQVMTNLLDNAVKFMRGQDKPEIEVGPWHEGDMTGIFVRDNGMGINHEDLPRIFRLYERLNPDIPGSGIGLATVKRIIEAHGGKIRAESEGEGKGTTFRFTLPGPAGKENDDL